MAQITNEVHYYNGWWESDGKCRLRMYVHDGRTIFIATELEENEGTSITNICERLATHIRRSYQVPLEKFVWIEHYPAWKDAVFGQEPEHYDLTTFEVDAAGAFQEPTWKRLTSAQVETLIGQSL